METIMAYALKYSLSVSIPIESCQVYSPSYFQLAEREEKAERKRYLAAAAEKKKLDAQFEVVWAEYLAKVEREKGNAMVAV